MKMEIVIRYRNRDEGRDEVQTFQDIASARRFAHGVMGEHPIISASMGRSYARARDCGQMLDASFCSMADLFPDA